MGRRDHIIKCYGLSKFSADIDNGRDYSVPGCDTEPDPVTGEWRPRRGFEGIANSILTQILTYGFEEFVEDYFQCGDELPFPSTFRQREVLRAISSLTKALMR